MKPKDSLQKEFGKLLLRWDRKENHRKLIWNGEAHPYRVWVREVMLQQTQIEQAKGYYDRFLSLFPTLEKLALAEESKVLKAWEGLGYYSRCRNLIHTAKVIHFNRKGVFPSNYEDLIQLKGIGDYTASAILSFCFKQDYVVYDGNVERIISRWIGFRKEVKQYKKILKKKANELLVKGKSADFNQAIMDFGALVCKPKHPLCHACPIHKSCVAFNKNLQTKIPFKGMKLARKHFYLIFFVFKAQNKIALQKDSKNLPWKQLYLFPHLSLEDEYFLNLDAFKNYLKHNLNKDLGKGFPRIIHDTISQDLFTQTLSHRKIYVRFVEVNTPSPEKISKYFSNLFWVEKGELSKKYFPKIIRDYFLQMA